MVRTIQLTGMVVICLLIHTMAFAQQGLLQQTQLQDYYRRLQLAGDSSIKGSFNVQPYQARSKQDLFRQKKDTFLFQSVVGITIQNNSALPYGYNDENLYPAIGLQQRVTVGARFETKDLLIQLQPEWVNAANKTGKPLLPPAMNSLGNYYARYFAMLGNRIDMPLYFGEQKLSTVYAGQSAVKYKFAGFAAGVSTENLWWGPARYNALIMGNNAPGFLHATLNTNTPFSTPIGEFEAQLVLGEMEASGITPPEFERMSQLGCPQCYEAPPTGKKRRMTGFVLSYSPKGIQNLSMGMAYASYRYADTSLRSSSLGSLFFRYAMPKDHAEIYAEYGRSDRMMSPFAIFQDSVPYGYTVGFRKMVPTKRKGDFISISAEISHLGLPKAKLILDRNNPFGPPNANSYSWYTSASIRHGYTHFGQVMGAAIGPGSNSQTLNIAWVSGHNQLGMQLQRVMRNTDFYYYNYFNGTTGSGTSSGETRAFWVDISASLFAQWQFKQLMIAGSIDHLSSINYKWLKLDGDFGSPSPLSDKKNFQIRLSMRYDIAW